MDCRNNLIEIAYISLTKACNYGIISRMQIGHLRKKKVFVATYTKEGLKIRLILGPLKFEGSKRGGDYTSRKITVATI